MPTAEDVLRSSPFFRRLSEEDLERLASIAVSKSYDKGEVLFLKLMDKLGRTEGDRVFIPLPLSRQDLADLTGTTLETSIRVMSRWGKEGIVTTAPDAFRIADRAVLERLGGG